MIKRGFIFFVTIILLSVFVYGGPNDVDSGEQIDTSQLLDETGVNVDLTDTGTITSNGDGTYIIVQAQTIELKDGNKISPTSDIVVNQAGTIVSGSFETENGNSINNAENYKTENGNIEAEYLEYTSDSDSIFSVLNPIDNTKITFNVPEGSNVIINNREPSVFEAVTDENVQGNVVGRCPTKLSFNSTKKQARLSITKPGEFPVYEISNGGLIFTKGNVKEVLDTERRSNVEVDNCNGFVCVDIAPDGKFSRINEKQGFSVSVPESGKKYKFCLRKKEGDGYIDNNRFKIDGVVNFFNFNNNLVYTGSNSNNKVDFDTNEFGIINEFNLRNKRGGLLGYLYPSKSFIIREDEGRFVSFEPYKSDYQTLDIYTTDTSVETPDLWLQDGILSQTTYPGNRIRLIPFQHPENGVILAEKSSLKYRGFLDG